MALIGSKDEANLAIEHYEKKIYDQQQLLEISKALYSTLDLDHLIDAILNISLAHLTTKAAIFLMPEFEATTFVFKKGVEITSFPETKIPANCELITFLHTHLRAITVEQLEKHESCRSPELDYFKNVGVDLIVPLSIRGRINGLLVLGEKITLTEFMDGEKSFFTILAGLAGIAVENARLYELATVDMMTQLKVHHFFQTKLREEIERCRKKNTNVSLLFTDVDKFKSFNDTYGHQAGDQVLIEVAKKLKEHSRSVDIAARYGGEEFCVIMPGVDANEAFLMGEKIRQSVQEHSVYNPALGNELKVTISVGVTEFHPSDKSNRDMIERADQALYQAKHNGRNQTKLKLYSH